MQAGEIRMYSKDGLFVLKRFTDGGELTLYCNRTHRAMPLAAEGRIAEENGYGNGQIDAEGFVIFRKASAEEG